MEWKKTADAAEAWCGGIHPQHLYKAVAQGRLKAARYGAGRNLLFCREWIDEWLTASSAGGVHIARAATGDDLVVLRVQQNAKKSGTGT